jgi:hypothetical protein
MRELGQFLVGPGVMLNAPSPSMAFGVFTLGITLLLSVFFLLRPLGRDISAIRILALIPLVALGSLLAVILVQWAAEWLYHEGLQKPHRLLILGRRGKDIFLLVVTFLVGWGYSRSLQPDSFVEHVFSFTLNTYSVSPWAPACWKNLDHMLADLATTHHRLARVLDELRVGLDDLYRQWRADQSWRGA